MKKIGVIGLGYVGLPVLVSLAETRKCKVVGFDVSEDKIKKWKEDREKKRN